MLLDAGEIATRKPRLYLETVHVRKSDAATPAKGKFERPVGKGTGSS
jgi:hypothetical protein